MKTAQPLLYFLQQHRKPYSLQMLADYIGIPLRDLAPLHAAQMDAGNTREVEPGIFISALAHATGPSRRIHGQAWNFDHDVAVRILDSLAQAPALSSRILGKRLGYSHQYVSIYLTALISIQAVGVTGLGYIALDRTNLSRLGCDYTPGIITEARKAAGIKSGGRNATWKHVPDYDDWPH